MVGNINSTTTVAVIMHDAKEGDYKAYLQDACELKCPVALYLRAHTVFNVNPKGASEFSNMYNRLINLIVTVVTIDYLANMKFREAMICKAEYLMQNSDLNIRVQAVQILHDVMELFEDGYAPYCLGMRILDQTLGGAYWAVRIIRDIFEGQPVENPIDIDKAETYFRTAIDRGYIPEAYLGLGLCFIERAKSPELYDIDIMTQVMRPREEKKEFIRECGREAVRYLQLSQFQTPLAYIYQRGELFVEKDEEKAVQIFETMASQGDIESMYELSEAYMQGKGVKKDMPKAAEWRLRMGDESYEPRAETLINFIWE